MTIWDILAASRRHWIVAALGVLLTALALMLVSNQHTVYYSRTSAYFLAPASAVNPNVLSTTSLDLVDTAGVIARRLNGTGAPPKLASTDATIVGRGIYDGTSISLIDNGGQWTSYFNVQALDIQVSGPSAQIVRKHQADAFDLISNELATLQDEQGVQAVDRIAVQLTPSSPTVVAMSGDRRRAQAMTVVAGASATLLALACFERRRIRRSARSGESATLSVPV